MQPLTPIQVTMDLEKRIRLLAKSGKDDFRRHLYIPLEEAGWKVEFSRENYSKLRERLHELSERGSDREALAPQCKRLISVAMKESLAAVGDACIFFLSLILRDLQVAQTPEAKEFINIIQPPLSEFHMLQQHQSENRFEKSLSELSEQDLKAKIEPVDLAKPTTKVYLEQEAYRLFQQIMAASQSDNLTRCRNLLSKYLIKYGDRENNNREQIDQLIEALEKKQNGFKKDLYSATAIQLYYMIVGGITEGNLKQSIKAIRKYIYIFQGNPEVPYYNEIDAFERKLYAIIRAKGLLSSLKRDNRE